MEFNQKIMAQPTIRELSVDDAKITVVKRIIQVMSTIIDQPSDHDQTMRLQGLGLALAFCFEEFTGHSSKGRRPSELMKWGFDLPAPLIRKVN